MFEVAMKPKLLRSLLREYVPDEKHAFNNPADLSHVISTVKTHQLLIEWSPQTVKQVVMDEWKSAVDSWVNRLINLASSDLPDKCWAGICLLGVTCKDCSSERFLASYSVWLNKLISQIQAPEVSQFVKRASCASLADLFTRLGGFPNAKKDGHSQATKVIQPALKLFNENISSLEEALCLICNLVNFFPFSISRHYDDVEAAIVSKIMSGECSPSVLKKLCYALSLLPKSRIAGDKDCWSVMMEKIILSINSHLNEAFQGLEEADRSNEIIRILFPSGKEHPAPLGGVKVSEQTSNLSTKRPERMLGLRISTLMNCCGLMLMNSYPVPVLVPIRGILALAGRVLMVGVLVSQSSYSFMTTLKQELICSEIPLIQLHSLEILEAVVKGVNSQILPHAADIVQLLTEFLRRCTITELRVKAYSIIKVLLTSMGIGTAIYMSQDIISNVFIDLDFIDCEKDGKNSSPIPNIHADSLTESKNKKKRKHSVSFQENTPREDMEVKTHQNSTQISVKIAALEALETLIIVGGSMRSESWRANVDRLLITVATNLCKDGWSDFRLASLRALLASLVSPGRQRPPHLSLSLELFRKGTQETGTKVGEFCGYALLSLEVLIHPRALSLLDDSSISDYKGVENFTLWSGPRLDEPESDNDDLDENWLGNDYDDNNCSEIQVTDTQQNAKITLTTARDSSLDELPSGKGNLVNHQSSENSQLRGKAVDEVRNTAVDVDLGDRSLTFASESVELEQINEGIMSMEEDVVKHDVLCEATKDEEYSTVVERISATLSKADTSKGFITFESNNDLDMDSFPDIVDGDPDSD